MWWGKSITSSCIRCVASKLLGTGGVVLYMRLHCCILLLIRWGRICMTKTVELGHHFAKVTKSGAKFTANQNGTTLLHFTFKLRCGKLLIAHTENTYCISLCLLQTMVWCLYAILCQRDIVVPETSLIIMSRFYQLHI